MKALQQAVAVPPKWTAYAAHAMKLGLTMEEARRIYDEETRRPLWKNDLYTVRVNELPDGAKHLSIRRNDRAPARDWRHFQQIKNQLAGEECEAVELYPAESRVVDTANQFHLWCLPLGEQFPIGYRKGIKSYDVGDPGFPFAQRAIGEGLP